MAKIEHLMFNKECQYVLTHRYGPAGLQWCLWVLQCAAISVRHNVEHQDKSSVIWSTELSVGTDSAFFLIEETTAVSDSNYELYLTKITMIYWIQFCFKNLKFVERKNIRVCTFEIFILSLKPKRRYYPQISLHCVKTCSTAIGMLHKILYRVISGFRCEVDENCALLGHYTAGSDNFLPTFRDNIWVHLQGSGILIPEDRTDRFSKYSCPFKMGPIFCPETPVTSHQPR